jgi:hypothetical protein
MINIASRDVRTTRPSSLRDRNCFIFSRKAIRAESVIVIIPSHGKTRGYARRLLESNPPDNMSGATIGSWILAVIGVGIALFIVLR